MAKEKFAEDAVRDKALWSELHHANACGARVVFDVLLESGLDLRKRKGKPLTDKQRDLRRLKARYLYTTDYGCKFVYTRELRKFMRLSPERRVEEMRRLAEDGAVIVAIAQALVDGHAIGRWNELHGRNA